METKSTEGLRNLILDQFGIRFDLEMEIEMLNLLEALVQVFSEYGGNNEPKRKI